MNIREGLGKNEFFAALLPRSKDRLWQFFQSRLQMDMCGYEKSELYHVRVEEDPEQKDEELVYWGWLGKDREEFSLIYPNRILFDVCFPYGPEVEEKHGNGRVVKLKVTILKKPGEK